MTSVTPYVMVDDANAFGQFVESTFSAEVANVVPLPTDPRRVIHAEARIGDGKLLFADSGPDGGRCLESPIDPVHVQLWTTVPDAEQTYARAVAAGARPALEVATQDDGSHFGGFVDPFGTLWWVSTPAWHRFGGRNTCRPFGCSYSARFDAAGGPTDTRCGPTSRGGERTSGPTPPRARCTTR